MPPMST
jgi:hypothetical protein